MGDMIKGKWSNASAFNLDLALKESREWIEAVTVTKFPSDDFQQSLKNGVLLCKLINQIKPGIVPKINQQTAEFAQRENLSFFIKACKQLGLRDTQLFESVSLYESQRLRDVAITLYWLGRAARGIATYKGPQLNLLAFQKMNCSSCKKPINDNNYLATLTQQWHTACAVCTQCHCHLDPKKPFYMEGNNIWCPNCMVGATKIGGSTGSPSNSGKSGQHGKHDNECVSCHGSLEKGYVPDEKDESMKYCTNCICDLCHNPLVGNFNVVNGQKICDECSCSQCSTPLKDGFFEEGLSRYCGPCADSRNKTKSKPTPSTGHTHDNHSHGHGHDHAHHNHPHSHPTSTTSTNNNNNNNNNNKKCKECDKPIDSKPKQGNDRDKFCKPHEDHVCDTCDKEIVGQQLQTMGHTYHPACFKCEKCQKVIKPGDPVSKSTKGNPVCKPCSGPSSGAGSPKCRSCDKQLRGQYAEIDGEPYCDPCADDLEKIMDKHGGGASQQLPETGIINGGWLPTDKCDGCRGALHGQVAKIHKAYFHMGCFKCDDCKASLTTGYFAHNQRPFCKKCSEKIQSQSSDTCPKCNKPILSGAIIKASNRSWHKQCFSCTTCNKLIGDGSTFTRFSKPYCKACWDHEKLQCVKCRNQINDEYVETAEGKTYCKKCAPEPTTTTIYGDKKPGFTIDPRSGKKTIRY